jgi:3-methyladenine DNA glycosylase AlkD
LTNSNIERETVQKILFPLAEDSYKKFSSKLIPTIDPDRILGVRVPALRKLATGMLKGDPVDVMGYLDALDTHQQYFHEEKLLWGILLGKAKMEDQERIKRYQAFVPVIDNWAVCDIACGAFPWIQRNSDFWLDFFEAHLKRSTEYEIRFGIVMMLGNYITEGYIDRVLVDLTQVHHPAYYVTMALGWTLAECYVKFPQKTEALLRSEVLASAVQNKAIQKIRESNSVSKENKEKMKGYKV